MAEAFTRRNFEFSTEEIARMVSRWRRLLEAKNSLGTAGGLAAGAFGGN
jgi:hypothetical protein